MQITPDKLRFELIINGISTNITDYVSNWEDIKIDYTRDDLKGVYINISNSIDFIGTAYSMLDSLYSANSFNANAVFVVSLRNDVLDPSLTLWDYSELKRVDLDFSTFKRTDYVISLNAKSNSFADLIKANKGTVYDIPVSELYPTTFNYDRLEMLNKLGVEPAIVDFDIQPENGDLKFKIPLDEQYHNLTFNQANSEVYDTNNVYLNDNGVIAFSDGTNAHVNAEFDCNFEEAGITGPSSDWCWVEICVKGGHYGGPSETTVLNRTAIYHGETKHISLVNSGPIGLSFIPGYVFMRLYGNDGTPVGPTPNGYVTISNIKTINVTYTSRSSTVTFDCITLQSIIDKLLYKIAGSGYTATVNTGLSNDIRLVPAESVRGFSNAKFHTSFEQFYNSMRAVFGLEYDISGNTIAFKPRSDLFKDTKAIDITDVTDLELSVNTSHIYSSLKIGFKKVDYNKVNGKDEFRFTNEFSSGVTVSTKKLELISDYRADAWGIEFLVQSRGEDTTDDQSDNDVFLLDCALNGSNLVPSRVIPITGVISPTTMFNVIFSPRNCLLRNALYLGISSSLFTFASSEGLSNIVINGVYENSNVTVNSKLFLPDTLKFKVGEIRALPTEKDGYVEFVYKGITHQGYIKELNHFIGKDQETTWTLFCKQKAIIPLMYINSEKEVITDIDTSTTFNINDNAELEVTQYEGDTDDYILNENGELILIY